MNREKTPLRDRWAVGTTASTTVAIEAVYPAGNSHEYHRAVARPRGMPYGLVNQSAIPVEQSVDPVAKCARGLWVDTADRGTHDVVVVCLETEVELPDDAQHRHECRRQAGTSHRRKAVVQPTAQAWTGTETQAAASRCVERLVDEKQRNQADEQHQFYGGDIPGEYCGGGVPVSERPTVTSAPLSRQVGSCGRTGGPGPHRPCRDRRVPRWSSMLPESRARTGTAGRGRDRCRGGSSVSATGMWGWIGRASLRAVRSGAGNGECALDTLDTPA